MKPSPIGRMEAQAPLDSWDKRLEKRWSCLNVIGTMGTGSCQCLKNMKFRNAHTCWYRCIIASRKRWLSEKNEDYSQGQDREDCKTHDPSLEHSLASSQAVIFDFEAVCFFAYELLLLNVMIFLDGETDLFHAAEKLHSWCCLKRVMVVRRTELVVFWM